MVTYRSSLLCGTGSLKFFQIRMLFSVLLRSCFVFIFLYNRCGYKFKKRKSVSGIISNKPHVCCLGYRNTEGELPCTCTRIINTDVELPGGGGDREEFSHCGLMEPSLSRTCANCFGLWHLSFGEEPEIINSNRNEPH